MSFKNLSISIYSLLTLIFLGYLSFPSPEFPAQITDSLKSTEPADIETPLRRSYFTDLPREEILAHYQREFILPYASFVPNYRLNYPPEEAQTLIRDQTRSVFLEEIVFPFRESFFVSGYKAKEDKDKIVVNQKEWQYKATVKIVSSSIYARLAVGLSTSIVLLWLIYEWKETLSSLLRISKRQ